MWLCVTAGGGNLPRTSRKKCTTRSRELATDTVTWSRRVFRSTRLVLMTTTPPEAWDIERQLVLISTVECIY